MPDANALLEESEGLTSDQLLAPGEYLAKARRKKKLTEKKVADALKITVAKLQAVEASDFSSFPSETYVKGYLRNYARVLSIPEQEVMDVYRAFFFTDDDPDLGLQIADDITLQAKEVTIDEPNKTKWWLIYLLLFLLVCAWGISNWLLVGQETDAAEVGLMESDFFEKQQAIIEPFPEDNSAQLASESEVPQPITPVEPGLALDSARSEDSVSQGEQLVSDIADSVVPDIASESETVVETAIESDSLSSQNITEPVELLGEPSPSLSDQTPESEPELLASRVTADKLIEPLRSFGLESEPLTDETLIDEAAAVTSALSNPEQDQDSLSFNFLNECWVEVIDDLGNLVYRGLNRSGSSLDLSGKSPFKVVIGQVEGTQLSLNGEPVILEAPRSGRVLRLQVGS